ncbi:MAG: amidohydrolase family protein [Fastidiosipilaceae bacterium]|nr:amidohydrolase family protein [Clostridiaceae bacterium]
MNRIITESNQTQDHSFVLKGHIVYTPSPEEMTCLPDHYLVCKEGYVEGVYQDLPQAAAHLPLYNCGDQIILPGMSDLHVHAGQYAYRGLGMDLELLDWLNEYAFPEEARFSDEDYAQKLYSLFAERVRHSTTTRLAAWGTIHAPATEILMAELAAAGLKGFVGKLNMDRNSSPAVTERTASSLADTEAWIERTKHRYPGIEPIITPRFIPSCTPELLQGLGELAARSGVRVQSHVSENLQEIAWVADLEPEAQSYSGAYDRYGLFGSTVPVIMAHMVHPSPHEWELMLQRDVTIAHCPASNMNVMSGLAPVKAFLDAGVQVGLGTDVAGGFCISMCRAITDAIQVSKLRAHLVATGQMAGALSSVGGSAGVGQNREAEVADTASAPRGQLTLTEGVWLSTKGGGRFFGKVGSFEAGYEFDAVVVDDSALCKALTFNLTQRVERLIYLYPEVKVSAKYVAGKKVL